MPDEPQVNVAAVIEAGPPAEGMVPKVEAPVTTEEPKGPSFTDDDLNSHLSKLTHDDLKKLPAWNAHLSRLSNQAFVEKSRWEDERRNLQGELQTAQMSAWQNYFRSLTPQQRLQAIDQDPKIAAAHAAVKIWESGGSAAQQGGGGNNVLAQLRQNLQSDETWSTIISEEIWSDVVNTANPAAALKKLVDAGRDHLTKAEATKFEAKVAEVKASVQGKEPSVPTGTSASGAGPEYDRRILDDPHSTVADKKAAFKRAYGFDYSER